MSGLLDKEFAALKLKFSSDEEIQTHITNIESDLDGYISSTKTRQENASIYLDDLESNRLKIIEYTAEYLKLLLVDIDIDTEFARCVLEKLAEKLHRIAEDAANRAICIEFLSFEGTKIETPKSLHESSLFDDSCESPSNLRVTNTCATQLIVESEHPNISIVVSNSERRIHVIHVVHHMIRIPSGENQKPSERVEVLELSLIGPDGYESEAFYLLGGFFSLEQLFPGVIKNGVYNYLYIKHLGLYVECQNRASPIPSPTLLQQYRQKQFPMVCAALSRFKSSFELIKLKRIRVLNLCHGHEQLGSLLEIDDAHHDVMTLSTRSINHRQQNNTLYTDSVDVILFNGSPLHIDPNHHGNKYSLETDLSRLIYLMKHAGNGQVLIYLGNIENFGEENLSSFKDDDIQWEVVETEQGTYSIIKHWKCQYIKTIISRWMAESQLMECDEARQFFLLFNNYFNTDRPYSKAQKYVLTKLLEIIDMAHHPKINKENLLFLLRYLNRVFKIVPDILINDPDELKSSICTVFSTQYEEELASQLPFFDPSLIDTCAIPANMMSPLLQDSSLTGSEAEQILHSKFRVLRSRTYSVRRETAAKILGEKHFDKSNDEKLELVQVTLHQPGQSKQRFFCFRFNLPLNLSLQAPTNSFHLLEQFFRLESIEVKTQDYWYLTFKDENRPGGKGKSAIAFYREQAYPAVKYELEKLPLQSLRVIEFAGGDGELGKMILTDKALSHRIESYVFSDYVEGHISDIETSEFANKHKASFIAHDVLTGALSSNHKANVILLSGLLQRQVLAGKQEALTALAHIKESLEPGGFIIICGYTNPLLSSIHFMKLGFALSQMDSFQDILPNTQTHVPRQFFSDRKIYVIRDTLGIESDCAVQPKISYLKK